MKKHVKQLIAIGGVLLLIALYLFTFVAAFLKIENWDRLFLASAVATIGVPLLIWIFVWLYNKVSDQRSSTSSDSDET